jgi:hypothetical protein
LSSVENFARENFCPNLSLVIFVPDGKFWGCFGVLVNGPLLCEALSLGLLALRLRRPRGVPVRSEYAGMVGRAVGCVQLEKER